MEELLAELDKLRVQEKDIIDTLWEKSALAKDLQGTVLSEENIRARVSVLADQIVAEYQGKELVLVGLMDGALQFSQLLCAELTRRNFPHNFTTMSVSSYDNDLVSGKLRKGAMPKVNLTGEHVLVLDDVADSGSTLLAILEAFAAVKPKSLKSMVLVDKVAVKTEVVNGVSVNTEQTRENKFTPNFRGFVVDLHAFIIGFGLDYRRKLRDKLSIKEANLDCLPKKGAENNPLERLDEVLKAIDAILNPQPVKLQAPGAHSVFAHDEVATVGADQANGLAFK